MFHPKGPTFWELAVQALSSTQRGYDLLAPKFDYTPFRTPQILLDACGEQLAALGPFDAGLDICCGTGAGMAMIRRYCRQRVTGIDFSQGMLEVAREHTAAAPGETRLEFVRGDVLAMPFAAAFDLAVSFGAFGHILKQDEPRFVAEIARVLKPGGRFVFITTYMPSLISPHYWFSRLFNAAMHVRNFLIKPEFIMYYLTFLLPEVETLLRQHGFDVEVREMGFKGMWPAARLVIATRGESR
ncbi:MAG TPA: class I SAM-dependent methyltransferase [Gemmataceae bacterium]|nr:class I SAM-dependent methyltransferase [Gemmataceae bacterium]